MSKRTCVKCGHNEMFFLGTPLRVCTLFGCCAGRVWPSGSGKECAYPPAKPEILTASREDVMRMVDAQIDERMLSLLTERVSKLEKHCAELEGRLAAKATHTTIPRPDLDKAVEQLAETELGRLLGKAWRKATARVEELEASLEVERRAMDSMLKLHADPQGARPNPHDPPRDMEP